MWELFKYAGKIDFNDVEKSKQEKKGLNCSK